MDEPLIKAHGIKQGKMPLHQVNRGNDRFLFCKKKGHVKKYPTFKHRLEKKSNLIFLVCFESNIVRVSHNIWWIDSGSTINIVNTM